MATPRLNERRTLILRDWLPRQRWYGDKSRTFRSLTPDELLVLELDSGLVSILIIACDFADGGRSSYVVPVQWRESGPNGETSPEIWDSFSNPDFLSWLYSGFSDARMARVSRNRILQWVPGAGSRRGPAIRLDGQVLGGEQSNTSVRFGDEAILKVFRKVHQGVNPDPEMLRFLSAHKGYTNVPADLGTIELQDVGSDEPIVIGAMQAFVPSSGDAWSWILEELRSGGEDSDQLLAQIALLGQRTGELHGALATGSDEPAFKVEHIDADYRVRLRQRINNELRDSLEAVRAQKLRTEAQISGLRDRLSATIAADRVLHGLALCRVHGDYHLGQVLRTDDDFVIIDFEGEPSRPLHERREKASPLKDVAGMLRSLDYAIASVLAENVPVDKRERLIRLRSQAGQAYIESYLKSLAAQEDSLVPADKVQFAAALSYFLIEKALYEVRYELDNRPDWIEIPLGALESIAAD